MAEPAIEAETASADVERRALELVSRHDPRSTGRRQFLGGLGVPRGLQASADVVLHDASGTHPFALNPIGYGMSAPRSWEHARPELAHELLRPLASCEHIWCPLFSAPGAGPAMTNDEAIPSFTDPQHR
jgi:alkylation response protein AidB-like acyl-CoA dehydrogenase